MPLQVFVSYSHDDARLMRRLLDHLAVLRRQQVIADWYDGEIPAGAKWAEEITERLESSSVILLLLSASFLASDFIDSVELRRALERHRAGEAKVIPILLKPVLLEGSPIGDLQMLPAGAKPVTKWADRDDAFRNIADGIRKAIGAAEEPLPLPGRVPGLMAQPSEAEVHQRTSEGEGATGLRVQKKNTRDRTSAPKRVSVRLLLLTELDERQNELDAFVRLYMELESGDRSAKASELIEVVRDGRPAAADSGLWRDAERGLNELKAIRGVQVPASELEELMQGFNEQLAEANFLIRSIMDRTGHTDAEPDEIAGKLLSALHDLYDSSEALLAMCRTGAEGCLRNIGSLLKLILHGVPQLDEDEAVRTQSQDAQLEQAATIVRQQRPSLHTSYSTASSAERGRRSR